MSWAARVALLVITLAAVLTGPGLARAANPAATIDQCRNGTFTSQAQCIDGAWQNGNLGETNSHYREDDSVPFRALLTNLATGSAVHTLVIQYDTMQGGKHAYDYLTSFDRTETTADPTHDVAGMTAGNCAPIPVDPLVTSAGVTQKPGCISIWNGTITDIQYGGTDAAGQRSVVVSFTANDPSLVIAWGGHIASQIDWGVGNSASAISGSPYHMRLLSLDNASLGNQDRSLKASGILPVVPSFFTDVQGADANGNVTVGSTVTDLASISGVASNGGPSGTVAFAVCGPNTANPDCSTSGGATAHMLTPSSVVVVSGLDGLATSPSFQPTVPGHYCFRAIYTPDAFAIYSPTEHTNQTTETSDLTVHGECFTVTPSAPVIATQASADVTVGGSIHDTVTLSGGFSPTGTITVKVFGPNDATCDGPALFTDSIPVDSGNGSYVSPAHVVNQAGTYRFVTSYSGDANNQAVSGACNDANESVVVGKASPSIATQASADVTVGGSIHDTVTLSGGFSLTGTLTVKVFGPNDATCDGPALFTDSITVDSGNGSYASPAHTVSQAGTYRFVAAYSGDANNTPVSGACNDANESVVVGKASPSVATHASADVAVGGSIHDTVTLSGGSSPTGTLTVKVFGPNDATCDGPALFTDSITVDSGNGSYVSPAHAVDVSGTYRFVAAYSGDANNQPVSGACNDANESVVVGKASPSVATQASADVTVGGSIHDTITLSGGFAPTGTLTVKVFGPNDATCDGSALFTDSIPVDSGNGSYVSPAHAVNQAGTYRFVASYSGDANNTPVSGACNDANESVVVGKAAPAVATHASADVTVGGSIHDTVTLSGGFSPTGTITVKVFGPNDATCDGPALFTDSVPVDSGNGSYPSPTHAVDQAGTYRFIASYSGDANNQAVSGACNDANESVVVGKASPAVATHASADVTVGGSIHDTVTLSGGFSPTGTITVKVFGPNNPTCDGPALFTDSVPVDSGNGSYISPAHTVDQAGTYRFVASYSGDANNQAVSGACNDANESVVVGKASPAVATQASADVTAGGSVHDTVTLSGGFSPTGTLTVKVFGPNDATCDGPALFTDSITVDSGNGSYVSPAHAVSQAGTYRFVAAYSGDANNQAVSGACNDANESVVVGKAAPSIATQASADVAVGGSIHDTVTLSGGFAPTGTLTVKVFGPNDPTCDGPARFTDSITVDNGNGSYPSPAHAVNQAGTYRFVASYSGDGNNQPVSGACNDANESVEVGPLTPSIETNASAPVTVGGSIHDTVTLSGGSAPTGTITVKVFGPNDATCDGPALFTDSITVDSGNGVYVSPAHAVNQAGTYRFVASYSGDANNHAVSGACNDANESVRVSHPGIAITKSPKSQTILSGSTATFTLVVTNTGDVPLTSVTVADAVAPNCAKTIGELAPGASTTITCSLAGATVSFTNTATATGHPPVGPDVTASDTARVTVIHPAISITKSPKSQTIVSGSTAAFTIVVKNTGDVALSSVAVSDAVAPGCAKTVGSLAPGQSETIACSLAGATASFTNTATATGHPPVGPDVTASDTADVTVIHPSISIAKDPDSQSIDAGGTATFTIVVKNTGDSALSSVTVSDPQAPGCDKAIGDLAAGATSSYTCALANVSSSFVNTATVTGHPLVGLDVTASDTASVTVNAVPPPVAPPPPPPAPPTPPAPTPPTPPTPAPPPVIDLQITKTDSPDPDELGNQLRYRITVKNNGPSTAHNVQMVDPLPVGVTFQSVSSTRGTCTGGQVVRCRIGTLNRGASATITIIVKAAQTGVVTNTATTVGKEAEKNTANNTATTTTLVKGPFRPPVATGCYAIAVTPHVLTAGKRSTLTLFLRTLGKPAKGIRVLVTGPGIKKTSGPSNAQGIARISLKPPKPGIISFRPVAHRGCAAPRIGAVGAFTPPLTG